MSVSVKDVALAASVSVGTVSNVLNRPEKVSPATVERVHTAIAELGFVRNDAARQLRAGRSRSIGLVVLDVGNPFFAEIARGAEERAAEENMTVLLGNSDERQDREHAYLDLFREQRVNGVLVSPTTEDLSSLERLRDGGVPVILVDRETSDEGFGSVAVDDIEGGFLAVGHLLEGGCRRVAFLAGPMGIRQVRDRLEGARRAVAQHPDAVLEVIEVPALTVLHGREAGQIIAGRAPADRPDGVFAANDLLAVGALQAFAIMGDIAVPDDIALIGYDDIDFASATVVPLSSIRQPAHLIGYSAADLLLKDLAQPDGDHERAVRFQPELVVRESTRRPR
ncbi:LacI family DNA-binding transcriptional regulator [Microbacterium sp. C7(2022)]|uniref:LacI family DNA-binding transcriptional regulator n=1 Tax=Microbacterium sp. C7(2022) TaxID=2992759 RepID=UPI00237BF6EF|nr:LacI family DNA-binding transcriptional regulator [Microbacterium sp. C7(2022)]MDE0546615.1 LacI family transcriptional regulator [Microbacterium sp. C7(2022)]